VENVWPQILGLKNSLWKNSLKGDALNISLHSTKINIHLANYLP